MGKRANTDASSSRQTKAKQAEPNSELNKDYYEEVYLFTINGDFESPEFWSRREAIRNMVRTNNFIVMRGIIRDAMTPYIDFGY